MVQVDALTESVEIDPVRLDALQAVLFAAHEPLAVDRLASILECSSEEVESTVAGLGLRLSHLGGLMLLDTPDGWRLVTKPEFWSYVERLREPQRIRLSKPALETLAIVAYRQPVTRAEIDQIRGVDCSGTLQTLVDRYLVTAVGRKEAPGRPVLYGTTSEFLEHFGLKELAELPELPEAALEALSSIEDRTVSGESQETVGRPQASMSESSEAEQQEAV